jgi:hypothetical protein
MRSVQLARAAADLRNQAGVTASLNPPAAEGTPLPAGVATPSSPMNLANEAMAAVGFGHNPAQTVPATPAAAAAAALQQASIAAQANQNSAEQQAAAKVLAAQQEAAAAQQAAIAQQAAQQAAAQQAAIAQQAAQQAAIAQQAAQQAAAQQAAIAQQAALAQQAAIAQQAAQQAAAQQTAAQLAQTTKNPAVGSQRFAPGAQSPLTQTAPIPVALESSPHSAPPSAPYFVTHRTVRVALSPAPNGNGEFSVHPLAEGEEVPAGWKDALLVALDPSERLFPGRG